MPGTHKKILLLFSVCLFFASKIILAQTQLTYATLFVDYDSAWECGNLKLIPIRFKEPGVPVAKKEEPQIIPFEQAWQDGKISVKEMSLTGGPDVGMLTVKNHSKNPVLIQSGEIMSGGKQDRAFAATTIIPPESGDTYVPVFCVEKGRWEDRIKSFHYAGPVDFSLRRQIDVAKKQNKVWKEIDKQLNSKNIDSKTAAYLNVFRGAFDTTCYNYFLKKMVASDSLYAGFVALTGDRIIDCEVYNSTSLCIASFNTMLKAYLRSITDKNKIVTVTNIAAKSFLDKFLKTEQQQKQYLDNHGAVYSYKDEVIQIIAYDY